MSETRLKKLPVLLTEEEAERFVKEADLSEHDLSGFKPMGLEFAPKNGRVNMRLPRDLRAAVKKEAQRRGLPYQRYLREVLERAVAVDDAGRQ